jgi:thiazole/oxazole-forming peptide maturase SagD family component
MPGFPFAPFRTASRRWWKDGRDRLSGRKIAVPAELVYFGGSVRALLRRPCSAATSSGVAAFADRESALERAVLELLERDAFMRAWLGRARTPRIPPRSLPGPARRRVSALNRLGLRVVVKILASDPVPVLMVFTQHPQRAFTVVGTAADYDWEKALDHALMECESTSIMRLQRGDVRRLEPSEVRFPEDHGDLYAQPRYFRGADFLARDGAEPSPRKAGAARSWKGLLEELRRRSLRLISVDLSPPGAAPGDAPLYVVRAIVPGLVPLSFGFGTEPLGIPEVQALLRRPNGPPLLPHPLA